MPDQPQFDALNEYDEVFHPGKPWRVVCHVVPPNGTVTGTPLTKFFDTEEQADEWLAMAGDEELPHLQENFLHAMRHHAAEHRDCKHTVPHG